MGAGIFISATHFLFSTSRIFRKKDIVPAYSIEWKMLAAKGAPPESEIKYKQKAQKDRAADKMFKGPKSTYHQHTHYKNSFEQSHLKRYLHVCSP